MKANVIPLEENKFYHIYNRGINGCAIFKNEGHYKKFLEKYAFHLSAPLFFGLFSSSNFSLLSLGCVVVLKLARIKFCCAEGETSLPRKDLGA